MDDLPEGDAARVWLYPTARRVIANQRRSRRRRSALHERLAVEAVTVAHESQSTDRERALVHEALLRLGRAIAKCCCWRSFFVRRPTRECARRHTFGKEDPDDDQV